MPKLDAVLWFAQSQPLKVHFKNQRALIVPGKAMSPESRRLRLGERVAYGVGRWQRHSPDTACRLLTRNT